jgi:hypothetical protein
VRKLMMVMAMLTLAGCGTAFEKAHEAVSQLLENPKTARFTNVRTTDQGNYCGQVKGKNAQGVYGPYRSYAAVPHGDQFEVVIDNDGNDPRVREVCGSAEELLAPVDVAEQPGQRWEVRIVSGRNMGSVTDMAARLVENGFVASFVQRDGQTLVYLGPFDSRAEAEKERARLMGSRGIESVVMPFSEADKP